MKYGFWSLIGTSFLRVQSIVIGSISLVLGAFYWYFSDVKSKWALIGVLSFIFLLILISVLISVIIQLMKSQYQLPKIVKVIRPKDKLICLLQPSELFSYGIGVSYYYTDENEFEHLIGIGRVCNIQGNKLIQINLNSYQEHHKDLIDRLENNDKHILDNIKVKPTVPADIDITA